MGERNGSGLPRPGWVVRVAMRWLLPERERRVALSELAELWEQRVEREGEALARRWYARQLRAYPLRLLGERLRRLIPVPSRGRIGSSNGRGNGDGVLAGAQGDVRQALRAWVKSPVLALTIVLTVSLGLGATTAMFAVVRVVLLEPLPYEGADRLVRIYQAVRGNRWPLSVVDYQAIEAEQTRFDAVAASSSGERTLTSGDLVERVRVRAVTSGWFDLLGINAAQGRVFEARDGELGAPPTAVVSWGFWQRHLDPAGSPLGRAIRLDGQDFAVIGVLPREVGPLEERFAVFPVLQLSPPTRRGPFFLNVIGRVRSGTDPGLAAAELHAINEGTSQTWGSWTGGTSTWGMMPLEEFVVGQFRTTLLVLLGAVALVLLVASTNAAGLLTARVAQRRIELATRAALGASRTRLVRLLVTESMLLALGGAAFGMALAATALRGIRTAGPDLLPRAGFTAFDPSVVGFAAALTCISLFVFGVIPALQLIGSGSGIAQTLRAGARTVTGATSAHNLRRTLVASQFSIAVPLLAGAALLMNSFVRLQRVDPGFDGDHVLTLRVTRLATDEASTEAAFWEQLLERAGGLPGVLAVGLSSGRPPRETSNINNFDPLDRPTPAGQAEPTAVWLIASPGYFDVLRIRLLAGRMFDQRDGPDLGSTSALVDRAWADNTYPGENPIGKQLYEGGCHSPDCSIVHVVGVVENVRYLGLDDAQQGAAVGTVYVPQSQWLESSPYLFLRTRGNPLQYVSSMRTTLRELDPTAAVSDVVDGADLVDAALAAPRNLASVVVGFAAVALILAMVGIYGVMSYFVHEHRKDIGIRLALGGRPAEVLGLIIGRGLKPVVIGTAIGLAISIAVMRFISRVLFGVSPHDPAILGSVALAMLVTAVAACSLPARHAARLDPAQVLRQD